MLITGKTMNEVTKKRQEYINQEALSFLKRKGFEDAEASGKYARELNKRLKTRGEKFEIFVKNEKCKYNKRLYRLHLEVYPRIVRGD